MTGYANTNADFARGALTLELRAVNHRYLDIQVRMPDELRSLEGELRALITAQLQRGKIECRINYVAHDAISGTTLNHERLQQLALWNQQVRVIIPEAPSLGVTDILHWDGILETSTTSNDELHETLLCLMQTALQEFTASRAREGEKLNDFLLLRLEKIEAIRTEVIPHIPAAIAAYEARLTARLKAALQSSEDELIRKEIALFASKIDVDEELSRLESHLIEMRRILKKGGAVGKRLDFLMQELNREANTLGSKSVDADVSRSAMEMKILIEQMREQIQNLE